VAGTRNSPMLSRSTLNSFVDIARRSCSRSPGLALRTGVPAPRCCGPRVGSLRYDHGS